MADVITRLKVESQEYDSKIKRATQGLMAMEEACRKVGGTLAILDKEDKAFVEGLGRMETVSKSARGRLNELTQAYTELSIQYKRLTDEEKKGDFGKALSSSLGQLKGRITDAKQQLAEVDKELGDASKSGIDFNSVLTSLGQRFGINSELMSVMTSGTLASTAAVTAGAAAVAYAAKQWAEYNGEIAKQQSMTATITGLQGGDAEELTAGARALAKTYDVDFRQAIEAANTLIHQFGVSGDEALSLLQDGMQGMIQGDGPKLLSMIQQYAPAFRDAGISASQLVAVIQNSEGGLFTDQNMSAIVMGIRNIRLMTKNTSEALAKLGIDGEEMSQKLENGSMTIFEALRQVAGKIDDVGSGSKAAGEVMQTVFGRQGTMAGTKLGEAIANLNTNLEETKTQTGEVGENLRLVNEKTMELERSLQEVFGTAKWDDWNTSLKTFAIEGMTFTVDWVGKLIEVNKQWNLLWIGIRKAGEALGLFEGKPVSFGDIGKSVSNSISNIGKTKSAFTVTTDSSGKVISASRNGQDVTEEYLKSQATQTVPTVKPTTPKGGGKAGAAWAPIEMQSFNFAAIPLGRSKADIQKDINYWKKIDSTSLDVAGSVEAQKNVEKYERELAARKEMENPFAEAYSYDFSKDMERLSKETKKDDKSAKEIYEKQLAATGEMVGGIQQMVGGLNQLGIEIPEGFNSLLGGLQGVITILEAIQTIQTAGAILGLFHNGGLIGKAAEGMLIPGNSYSGDHLRMPVDGGAGWIGVNSGELILNKSQQNSIAGQLTAAERGGGGYQGTPYVEGEKIFLGINNYLRRSGRGEIVTSR